MRIRPAAIIACALLLVAACRQSQNRPPNGPVFTGGFRYGAGLGSRDVLLRFEVAARDSDEDAVRYRLSWGDGDTSDWSELTPSDSPVMMTHSWQDTGEYVVSALAQDEHGLTSSLTSQGNMTIIDEAPDFSLTDLNGDTVNLYRLLSTGPVHIVWWDLPCVNSIQEVDELQQVYDSLSPRGFTLLAISVDKSSDEARVRSFVATKGWRCPVLLDSTRLCKDLYGIIVKPTGILVNTDTAVAYTHVGYKKGEWEAIKAEILRWLPPGLAGGPHRRRI